jgi:hypothetical protein
MTTQSSDGTERRDLVRQDSLIMNTNPESREIWILASEMNSWVEIRVHIYIIIIVGAVGGYIREKRSKLPHC